MTKRVGIEAARKQLPALVDAAGRGEAVLITRRGRPCAALVAPDRIDAGSGRLTLRALAGSGHGLWGKDSADWLRRLRREWE